MRRLAFLLLLPALALAQATNTFQAQQPFRNNALLSVIGGRTGYQYGSDTEGDVSLHFKFTEASGDIVDTIVPVTLADYTSTGFTYRVPGDGDYFNFYGIQFPDDNGDYFLNGSNVPALDIPATSGLTWEWVAKYEAGASYRTVFGDGKNFFYLYAPNAYIYIETTAGAVAFQPTVGTGWKDGSIHKFRIVVSNRGVSDGTIELFIDGVSQGSAVTGALRSSGTSAGTYMAFGARGGALYKTLGTMFEFRYSKNSTNNSGGRGGG